MFTPIVPSSGLTGWRFLQRTYDTQIESFANSSQITRSTEYFKENIGKVKTAEDLTSDRRLLEVALGAFGIQDDIDNKYFIQKILDEGTTARDSLANRFSDNRYQEFSKAFGLGPGESSPIENSGFVDDIVARYNANSFEVSAGQQNDSMRLALYAQRVLGELASPPVKSEQRQAAEQIASAVTEFSTQVEDKTDYFAGNIGLVASAEDLVADTQLLEIVLGAFGLQEDFEAIISFEPDENTPVSPELEKIQRVLEEGSVANTALANQLDNPAYRDLASAFGFGIAEDVQVRQIGFSDLIIDSYISKNFEFPSDVEYDLPVVISNGSFELEAIDETDMSNDAKWFTIMGEPPLRSLFENALNLPSEFGQIDIDQQLTVFKERAKAVFGSDQVNQFSDPDVLDDLITKFVVRSQLNEFNGSASSASIALTLLQS
ncbi:DUF1217 domain-containing protein [Roseobacter sp.]|uniref:DUF1217 domain-containing protein n=1 Tax=Roseobacter sp. TaxID=1907202 RepID=UPI00385D4820